MSSRERTTKDTTQKGKVQFTKGVVTLEGEAKQEVRVVNPRKNKRGARGDENLATLYYAAVGEKLKAKDKQNLATGGR